MGSTDIESTKVCSHSEERQPTEGSCGGNLYRKGPPGAAYAALQSPAPEVLYHKPARLFGSGI